jgi:homoserine dehydrogenase
VVADEAGVLSRRSPPSWPSHDISIDAVLQRESAEVSGEAGTQTDLIILTHDTVREGIG